MADIDHQPATPTNERSDRARLEDATASDNEDLSRRQTRMIWEGGPVLDDPEEQEDGNYRLTAPSYDGTITMTVSLADIADVSDGRLTDDEATARATLGYLLTHQDAADLPELIDITDVAAAYDDAIDAIAKKVTRQGEP